MRYYIAIALLAAMLVIGFGCTQQSPEHQSTSNVLTNSSAGPSAPAQAANASQQLKVSADDLGVLDNPDSQSLDTGIPLEDI